MKANNKSFTLIELLVVIVIIGILAGVIMISTSSSIDKANMAKSKVFAESIKNNLMLNLVSEWTFDKGSDQAVNRIATNDDVKDTWGFNDGIVYGNPQIKGGGDCISGKCLHFNEEGSNGDDYIDVNINDKSFFQLQNFTINTFVNTLIKGSLGSVVFMHGEPVNRSTSGYVLYANNFYIITDSGQKSCSFNPSKDGWHLLTATYDKSIMKIYIDGELKNEKNVSKF